MDRTSVSRWLIPLPAILFSLYPLAARAEPVAGLNAVGYKITGAPPTKSDTAYQTCGSELENNINRNFDGEPFQQCGADWFMLHYTGFIAIPANNTISFMVAADDGGTVKIGDTEFGTWNNKGCSWSAQTGTPFAAGSYPLDGWFYEASGLTCFMLAWNINGQGWQIVPDNAFMTAPTATTTTTTSTTTSTTTTSSTTTLPVPTSTTTSTVQPVSTTATPTTTTTVQTPPQTTTSTSTTTTATTTTTTPLTTTTATPTVQTPEPETVPTIEPSTTTTQTTTTTTEPPTTTVQTTSTSLPIDETTTTQATSTTTKPTTSQPLTTRPSTTAETPNNITTTTTANPSISDTKPTAEPNAEQVLDLSTGGLSNLENIDLVRALDTITDDQVDVVVGALLAQDNGATDQQALSLASSAQILENIDSDQADAIFEAVDVAALTAAEGQAIVDAVNQAPDKVKSSFQAQINIFSGVFDDYVPIGSSVPVGVRRAIVAAGGTLAIVAAGRRAR